MVVTVQKVSLTCLYPIKRKMHVCKIYHTYPQPNGVPEPFPDGLHMIPQEFQNKENHPILWSQRCSRATQRCSRTHPRCVPQSTKFDLKNGMHLGSVAELLWVSWNTFETIIFNDCSHFWNSCGFKWNTFGMSSGTPLGCG